MKQQSTLSFLFCLVMLLAVSVGYAQNYTADTNAPSGLNTSLDNGAVDNLLNNQAPTSGSASDNIIFVNQIGDRNTVEITNNVEATSNLDIAQLGNNNLVFLSAQAKTLIQDILQEGDGHEVLNFSNNPNVQDLEIIQRGTDQNIIFHGTNSISEKMKINMEGNSQSIIVRSFN